MTHMVYKDPFIWICTNCSQDSCWPSDILRVGILRVLRQAGLPSLVHRISESIALLMCPILSKWSREMVLQIPSISRKINIGHFRPPRIPRSLQYSHFYPFLISRCWTAWCCCCWLSPCWPPWGMPGIRWATCSSRTGVPPSSPTWRCASWKLTSDQPQFLHENLHNFYLLLLLLSIQVHINKKTGKKIIVILIIAGMDCDRD